MRNSIRWFPVLVLVSAVDAHAQELPTMDDGVGLEHADGAAKAHPVVRRQQCLSVRSGDAWQRQYDGREKLLFHRCFPRCESALDSLSHPQVNR